jgi:Strictosidine synthase
MSLARDVVDRIFFPGRDVHAIPVLDGGFSPNERLESARQLGAGIDAPDALAMDGAGTVYVSSRRAVYACSGQDFASRRPFAEFDSEAGALAWSQRTGLLVCVSGRGLCALDADGRTRVWLEQADGAPIGCPTAVAIAGDGSIFVADGSRHNGPEQWLTDLMQKRAPSGRLILCDADLAGARVVVDRLAWPGGVTLAHDESSVLVPEAWAHGLSSYARTNWAPQKLVKNFAGYPCRIVRGANRDYWIAFFALRTQLTEFVLREDGFRTRMMAEVPQKLWVGPTLGDFFDYREPTQIGRIKKLGIQKPWAPPRSYGLVARLDADGRAIESFHSRTSGRLHGITDIGEYDGRVIVVSKGHGKLAVLPREGQA